MRKNIVVLQEEISDCGVCSLLSIIKYYKGMANLEELRIDSNTTSDGTNAYNLIKCANKYGMEAKGLKVDSLDNITLPCIVHFKLPNNLFHFSVLYEIKENYLLVMDPAKGLVKMPKEYFKTIFTGVVITMYPRSELIKYNKTNTLLKCYKLFIKNNKLIIFILILISIINLLLNLITSYFIEIRIKYKYYFIIILFIIFELIKSLTQYIIEYKSKQIENRLSLGLQQLFLSFILKIPLNYIHLKKPGEILVRFEELELIKEFLSRLLINIFINALSFISILSIFIYYNYKLLIPVSIYMVLYILMNILYGQSISKYVRNSIDTNTSYKSYLVDTINGLTSINHSNSSNYHNNKVINNYNTYLDSTLSLIKYSSKYKELFNFISNILVIILNVILINSLDNYISIIFINYLIVYLIRYYDSLVSLIPLFYYIRSYISKCNDLLDIDFKDTATLNYYSGDIVLTNVSYSYNQIDNILNNINITIRKGEKIILKGSSGKGKSTICKLLTKELSDYAGSILIGNQELKNINRTSLNNNIYYLSQEEHIFIDTIKNNITLGNSVDENTLKIVEKVCELDNIVNKRPFRYDTYLNGGENELSGGERNRIILARTLLDNKDIIILDECLREVSSHQELRIINNLFKYFQNKTIIYITHKDLDYPGRVVNI